jgi:hypothetical protein
MHYSIQQDLARNRVDDLLREATRAQRAAELRESRVDESKPRRLDTLLSVIHRRRPHLRPVHVS